MQTATVVPIKTAPELHKKAVECYDSAGGDLKKAKQLFSELELTDEEIRLLIHIGTSKIFQKLLKDRRHTMINQAVQQNKAGKDASIAGLEISGLRNLYDFPLANGVKLGLARKKDLEATMTMYSRSMKTLAVRYLFLRKVFMKMGEVETVQARWKLTELNRLMAESAREAPKII